MAEKYPDGDRELTSIQSLPRLVSSSALHLDASSDVSYLFLRRDKFQSGFWSLCKDVDLLGRTLMIISIIMRNRLPIRAKSKIEVLALRLIIRIL